MASQPSRTPSSPEDSSPLNSEQWWALFDQLRLSQQAGYAEYDGPVAFFRKERDADLVLP
jgi:hypothetical protein